MTTSTFYGDAGDGYLYSTDYDDLGNPSYDYARAGTGSQGIGVDAGANTLAVGQSYQYEDYGYGLYQCIEGFLSFPTSDIPDGDTISTVTLSLWLYGDYSTTDFIVRARIKTYGTLGAADWVTSYTQTLAATINTSGIGSTGAYKNFVSESAFVNNINKVGTTQLVLISSRQEFGTAPGVNPEEVSWQASDYAGTTQDPKLVVVHDASSTTYTKANSIDSHLKKEWRTYNNLDGTSGEKVTRENSGIACDPFSTVVP